MEAPVLVLTLMLWVSAHRALMPSAPGTPDLPLRKVEPLGLARDHLHSVPARPSLLHTA